MFTDFYAKILKKFLLSACVLTLLYGCFLHIALASTTQQACQALHQTIETISQDLCNEVQFSRIPLASKKHRLPIIYKKLHHQAETDKPRILLLGGIHANELSSFDLVMKWTHKLRRQKKSLYSWLTIPAVNINALLRPQPTRQNINDVDINRNFPLSANSLDSPLILWERDGSKPRRYPGVKPFSEIETKTIDKLIQSFKPQLIISMHAPLDFIDYDGLPQHAPAKLGALSLKLTSSYPGSLANYYWNVKRIPVLTIELDNAQKLPPAIQVSHIWYDLLRWLDRQYYPDLVPKDDVATFNEAMEALSLNNLTKATFLFTQIKDKDLYIEAQNNLAYILHSQNKTEQAQKIWEEIINQQNSALLTVLNNYINNKNKTNPFGIQLLPVPTKLLTQSNDLQALHWRFKAWKDAWLNGESSLYFSLYTDNQSPTKGMDYKQWRKQQEQALSQKKLPRLSLENIQHKVTIPNQKAETIFKQVTHSEKQKTTIQKKLLWEKHQDNWKISREIIIKK